MWAQAARIGDEFVERGDEVRAGSKRRGTATLRHEEAGEETRSERELAAVR